MDISKHIIYIDMPDEAVAAYIENLAKGDPRCRLTVGQKVRKVFVDGGDGDDINPVGSEGEIVGSMYKEKADYTKWGLNRDVYFVNFTNSPLHSSIKKKDRNCILKLGNSSRITTACVGVKLIKL